MTFSTWVLRALLAAVAAFRLFEQLCKSSYSHDLWDNQHRMQKKIKIKMFQVYRTMKFDSTIEKN